LLWGRLLLKQMPRTAQAVPDHDALVLAAERAMTTEPIEFDDREVVYVDLPSSLKRDLFALNARFYRARQVDEPEPQSEEKFNNQRPDDLSGAIDRAKAELVLQATLLGDEPKALINGQMLRVGQTIRGFKLTNVRQHEVTLEKNGIEIRLEL